VAGHAGRVRRGWLVQPPGQCPKRQRGGQDADQGGVHAQRAGQPVAHTGRPRRRRITSVVAEADQDAGQLAEGYVGPGAGGEQACQLADQPHQPTHHHDGADGDQQQGVVGLVVLELGAGQALALGPLRLHHSLRAARLARDWSEDDLADQIQNWEYRHGAGRHLGVSRSYVSEWETGKQGSAAPTPSALRA
jgi:hypothetical protein